MLKFTKQTDTTNLDNMIDKAFADASQHPTYSPEFAACMDHIDRLYALRYPSLKKEAKKHIDPNELIRAGSSLLGIFSILGYEHGHAIASKALGFVRK